MKSQFDRLCDKCEEYLVRHDAAKTDAERAVLLRLAAEQYCTAARIARFGGVL